MPFQDLPLEVIDHIVDTISDDKLLRNIRDRHAYEACSLVSRAFVVRCQMWLFFYLRFLNPKYSDPLTQETVQMVLADRFSQSPHLSKYVKRIDHRGTRWLQPDWTTTSRWESLHILIEACTDLVELNLIQCNVKESRKEPDGAPLSHPAVRSLGLLKCNCELSFFVLLLSQFPSLDKLTLGLTLEPPLWTTEPIPAVTFPNVRILEIVRALERPSVLANQLATLFPAVQQLVVDDQHEHMLDFVPGFIRVLSGTLRHLHLKFFPRWMSESQQHLDLSPLCNLQTLSFDLLANWPEDLFDYVSPLLEDISSNCLQVVCIYCQLCSAEKRPVEGVSTGPPKRLHLTTWTKIDWTRIDAALAAHRQPNLRTVVVHVGWPCLHTFPSEQEVQDWLPGLMGRGVLRVEITSDRRDSGRVV